MNELTKLGTSLLNMDEISQYLWLKGVDFSNKTYPEGFDETASSGFLLRGEKANDTKKVADKDALNIAVAYEDASGNVNDRTTVRNAMTLNNYPPSSFVLQSEKHLLTNSIGKISNNFLSEIRDLRDELYQIRAKLSKTGMIQAYKPYAGFYDTFRTQYPVHMNQPVAYAKSDSSARNFIKVTDAEYDLFQKGDYLFIVSDTDESCVVKIDSLGTDHQTLNFTHSATFDIKSGCKIYKSHGNTINGTFTFGKVNVRSVDLNNKVVTAVNDDTNLIMRPMPSSPSIGNKHVDIAFTFRIPETMQGNYLVNLEIMGKQYGAPGDMICYIIDERNADKWRNPAQAKSDGLIVAQSTPVKAEQEINITQAVHSIEFNFYDASADEYLILLITVRTISKLSI